MGKSLAEYAAQNPMQEPERERQAIEETARSYREQILPRSKSNRRGAKGKHIATAGTGQRPGNYSLYGIAGNRHFNP